MLKRTVTTMEGEIVRKQIKEDEKGNLIYFNFNGTKGGIPEIEKSEYNAIDYVSVNENGEILGRFIAYYSAWRRTVYSCEFVKFKEFINSSNNKIENDSIFSEDIDNFMKMLLTEYCHKIKVVHFMTIAENKNAIRRYDKWTNMFNGGRIGELYKYAIDTYGKSHDVLLYEFRAMEVSDE